MRYVIFFVLILSRPGINCAREVALLVYRIFVHHLFPLNDDSERETNWSQSDL